MNLRDVKVLAAGVIVVSLVTTNFIIPAVLEDIPPLRVTAITKPAPVQAEIPEPVRVLTPAESTARAAAMRAHADRALAENGELPGQTDTVATGQATGTLTCVAGCN